MDETGVAYPGAKIRSSRSIWTGMNETRVAYPGAKPLGQPAGIVPLQPASRFRPASRSTTRVQVPMARQTQAEIETEKRKNAERETARTGKVLGSQPGSEEERRQQALAMLKKKTQAKRDGKRIAADESAADIAHKQAPPKKARAPRVQGGGALLLEKSNQEANLTISTQVPIPQPKPPTKRPTSQLVCEEVHQEQVLKDQKLRAKHKKEGKRPVVEESNSEKAEDPSPDSDEDPSPDSDEDHVPPKRKNFNAGRDRKKKPTEAELVEQMRKGIAWPPTRFVDRSILQALYLDDDVKEMLEFMKIGSFYSVAYQTYPEVSCQFLSTLEATFHTKKIAQQVGEESPLRSLVSLTPCPSQRLEKLLASMMGGIQLFLSSPMHQKTKESKT
ncbi:Uncharacterized protein Rs2_41019 [Raphanus sativus]|nr:Uncharacterized protein Rs2_41019 [Raphanus sativus]